MNKLRHYARFGSCYRTPSTVSSAALTRRTYTAALTLSLTYDLSGLIHTDLSALRNEREGNDAGVWDPVELHQGQLYSGI
jgi:hypothetical protein